ncbi:hypothetical protein Syun_031255 [Stephania yunnanensis]|uniref:SAP domain-containing protein n=1 Tax=Stephania yunnanensis TaxID=152371 RepID=A0AAP0E1M6_9MAGN
MDLVSSCKEKLAYFRLKELKDVLGKLGLAKQGKKQDLMDRVLAMLSDEQGSKAHSWAKKNSIGKEGVAKIIDDTYRKMGIPGASDLASSGHSGSDTNKVKFKEEDDSFQFDTNIRCPCGNSLSTDSLIQCEDPKCHVWQHMSCVIIPEKPMDGAQPERPPRFYCEICRVSRADPFWSTMAHPLYPVKLAATSLPADGKGMRHYEGQRMVGAVKEGVGETCAQTGEAYGRYSLQLFL